MATECMDEGAVARAPDFDAVVEGGGGDVLARGGEGDVGDGFGVAEEAGEGFLVGGGGGGGFGGGPEEDCEVVACGYETFDDTAVGRGGFLEAGFCFGEFFGGGGGDGVCGGGVVVGGAENEFRGEGEVVDPVGVGGEGADEGSLGGVPEFDGFVVGGGVDCSRAAPADAGDGGFVAGEDEVDAFGDGVPDTDRGVLGAGGEPDGCCLFAEVVGFPGEAVDPFGVAGQGLAEALAGFGIPESDGVVH